MRRLTRFIARFVASVFARWANAADRARIAELERELADAQHEQRKTANELEIANAQNTLLSEIHEADCERRRMEKAVFASRRAVAVAATTQNQRDDSEG